MIQRFSFRYISDDSMRHLDSFFLILYNLHMAKKEQRILFAFVCTVCKSQNYITSKNKLNIPEKLSLNKYCKMCKKHT